MPVISRGRYFSGKFYWFVQPVAPASNRDAWVRYLRSQGMLVRWVRAGRLRGGYVYNIFARRKEPRRSF